MSIVCAGAAEPPLWVWTVWLVAAIAVGVVGLLRPRRNGTIEPNFAELAASPSPVTSPPANGADAEDAAASRRDLQRVPLLAVTALISFCAWVGTQLVYVSIRQPAAAEAVRAWSSADLARLSLLSFVVGWVIGFGLLVYGRGVQAIGFGWRRAPSGLLAGAIGIFVALPVVFFCLQATLTVLGWLMIEHPQKHELLVVLEGSAGRSVQVMAIVSAVFAAPLFEEMLFRGCVQGGLRRATGSRWVAILVASLLFAVIHPPWTIPPIFAFSVLLGLVYDRTRNLWATTTMHALFNAFAIFNNGMN